MGKKLKGGRRQILQLEEKRHPKASSKTKMKSLIHYSDSDDDSKKSNDSESYPLGISQNNDAAPLESEIADFFKEIDALSVPEELSIEPDKATSSENTLEANSSDTAVDLPAPNGKDDNLCDAPCEAGAYCPWQEICDSSTGYSYYWNIQTNEVTWDCPPEYAVFIKSVNTSTKTATYEAHNNKYRDEKEKKKKKFDVEVLEGAIIPISYFGNSSSSDNSSDSENELTNKKPKSENFSELKKNKIFQKTESRIESNETENNEPIGPSLPPDYKFPKADSDIIESSSQMTVSQNEIDEVSLVCSSVSPNCLYNITEKSSQSDLDEIPIETTCASSWENEKPGDESPDISVKRRKNFLNQNAYKGFRPVVEYDSFTDEDEEICITNIQSPKTNRCKQSCEVNSPSHQEQESMSEHSNSPNMLAVALNDANNFKRKSSETLNENIKKEVLIKKPKIRDVNIDNLFASHSTSTSSKCGFGWKNQLDEQNHELFTSTLEYETKKTRSKFQIVSFVKSEDILDLKTLNDETTCDETNDVLSDISTQISTKCIKSNALEQHVKHILNNELIMKSPIKESVEIPNDCNADSSGVNIKEISDSIISKKKKADKFNFNPISTSLQVDDDLDAIDKALCEALDAKMSAKNPSLKSLPPVSDVSNIPENTLESTSTQFVEKPKESDEIACKNVLDADAITDDILEISSDLIDKLTFLLSSPCTHASFSGIFFQLQTRFVDWQAGALDSKYFMARLKELEQYIQHYEMGVISGEWTYQWDRENKRYFFINSKTQHSQWTYPEEFCNQYKSSWHQAEAGTSSASSFAAELDDFQIVSSSIKHNISAQKDISSGTKEIFQSPPPVDSPPPPPHIPPPNSPPPPPDSPGIWREPEDMDIENSNDSSSFLFVNNKNIADDKQVQLLSMEKQSSKGSPKSFTDSPTFSAVSTSLPSCEDLHNAPHTFDTSKVNNMHWSQPSFSSEVKINCYSTGNALISTGLPVKLIEERNADNIVSSGNGIVSSQFNLLHLKATKSTNPVSKKEKKKTKIQPGLGHKKKIISSLVEKWQKIKEQQDKEDNDSDDCINGNSF